LARRLNTGLVHINSVLLGVGQTPVPFGGWNDSGLGFRSGGAGGIRKYCRTKSIVADRVAMKKELLWYPYTPRNSGHRQGAVLLPLRNERSTGIFG
jgi:hypothetical protein